MDMSPVQPFSKCSGTKRQVCVEEEEARREGIDVEREKWEDEKT